MESPPISEVHCQEGPKAKGRKGSQSEGAQGLCFEDPETGKIICSDSGEEASNVEAGMQVGCYQDPTTGKYVCIN